MQNIPDKGVSGPSHYLQAEYTVTGLSGSLPGVKRRIGEKLQGFPFWAVGLMLRDQPITNSRDWEFRCDGTASWNQLVTFSRESV
jgi:hypothetical protein